MRGLTQEELGAFVVKTLKDSLGSDLAAVIREQVEKAVEPLKAQQTTWFDGMKRGIAGAGDAEGAEAPKPLDRSLMLGRMARALGLHRGNVERAMEYAKKEWKDEVLVKAMAAGVPTAGGFLVPEQFSTEVIDLLRPAVWVRKMGPVILPMGAAQVRVSKITSGTSASYIGENTNIVKSQAGTGQLTLSFKKLAALVPLSNDLLRYSAPGADAIVRNDIVRAMAQRENQAFIRDDGTGGTPKGLRYWVPAASIVGANATVNLANVTVDLGKLILKLMENNVPITKGGFGFAPRTYHYLTTVQNANGYFPFRDEMLRGVLWGYPYGVTTQIPVNLTDGGGTAESEVYFADFDDVVIGEAQNLIVDASSEAAYHDGANVVAAYSQDQTVIRCIAEHDFIVRRDVSVAVLNKVNWGA